jgi:threonine dehydratase
VKERFLELCGATIDASYDTVAEGVTTAQQLAEEDPTVAFLHPYNDPNGIAGQAMVGRRIVTGLLAQSAQGSLDLHKDPVVINVQVGGGSLLTGVACAVVEAKEAGLFGNNVYVQAVRPERKTDGTLNEKYDGLFVEEPGSYAQAILQDSRFVQSTTTVSEHDSGLAAHRLATALRKPIEPAGLAGAAAFEQQAPENTTPTVYVSIASGENVTPALYEHFRDEPRRHQNAIIGLGGLIVNQAPLTPEPTIPSRTGVTQVASSPTAAYRTGLVVPKGRA